MKLSDVKNILKATVLVGNDKLGIQIKDAAASDLMSDLLSNYQEGALLLTGMSNIQVIHTSVIAGIAAIVFVRGKEPNSDVIALAEEHGIPILKSSYNMYSSCGMLFLNGLQNIR
jgi:predicted transcriptional regulator